MAQVDYKYLADTYDAARPISEKNLELWLNIISRAVGPRQDVKFLDIGCGTGRFAIPIATKLGYLVTGCDNSREMITKAKEKDLEGKVKWNVESAVSLSYLDSSFDVVFMSHLLQHIKEPLKTIQEVYRILKTGGKIINRYGAIENISQDPERVFFPEALEYDKARTPSIEQVEKWFKVAGFKDISSETITQKTYASATERYDKVRLKSNSVLNLITQNAFEEGLRRLDKYTQKHQDDPWLLVDKLTLTIGTK